MEWQPIETAPKDGTQVILYSPDRCENCPPDAVGMSMAKWDGGWVVGTMYPSGRNIFFNHEPTHWILAPEPPK